MGIKDALNRWNQKRLANKADRRANALTRLNSKLKTKGGSAKQVPISTDRLRSLVQSAKVAEETTATMEVATRQGVQRVPVRLKGEDFGNAGKLAEVAESAASSNQRIDDLIDDLEVLKEELAELRADIGDGGAEDLGEAFDEADTYSARQWRNFGTLFEGAVSVLNAGDDVVNPAFIQIAEVAEGWVNTSLADDSIDRSTAEMLMWAAGIAKAVAYYKPARGLMSVFESDPDAKSRLLALVEPSTTTTTTAETTETAEVETLGL